MAGSKLQIRGDTQIQLANVGYELRRLHEDHAELVGFYISALNDHPKTSSRNPLA